MNYPIFKRPKRKRFVFVWDGTDRYIETADRFLSGFSGIGVDVVHTMPNTSIYTHNSLNESDELSTLERRLIQRFLAAVRPTELLRHAKLELLFGDRVQEIGRYAQIRKAQCVLTPYFEQSSFSKWIHGDLNQKLSRKLNCPAIFLDSLSGSWFSHDGQRIELGKFTPEPTSQ